MTALERFEKRLDKYEKIAADNSAILHNGLGDTVTALSKTLKAVEMKIVAMSLTIENLPCPSEPMSGWKKFAFKWGGTFIILAMFIALIWVAFELLPHDTVEKIIDAAIRSRA